MFVCPGGNWKESIQSTTKGIKHNWISLTRECHVSSKYWCISGQLRIIYSVICIQSFVWAYRTWLRGCVLVHIMLPILHCNRGILWKRCIVAHYFSNRKCLFSSYRQHCLVKKKSNEINTELTLVLYVFKNWIVFYLLQSQWCTAGIQNIFLG